MTGRRHALMPALLAAALAAPAAATDPATLAAQGGNGVAACAGCHGADGGGQGAFPRLAGLDADYLRKQLDDFASGRRRNAVMQPIAGALDAGARSAMAGYYAGLPLPRKPSPPPPAADAPGTRLALRGAWERGIPGCTRCHGPAGRGVGTAFPPLAGQPAEYLVAQLQAFRAGTRANDPLELMRQLPARLAEAEIRATADWFAAQPLRGDAP